MGRTVAALGCSRLSTEEDTGGGSLGIWRGKEERAGGRRGRREKEGEEAEGGEVGNMEFGTLGIICMIYGDKYMFA